MNLHSYCPDRPQDPEAEEEPGNSRFRFRQHYLTSSFWPIRHQLLLYRLLYPTKHCPKRFLFLVCSFAKKNTVFGLAKSSEYQSETFAPHPHFLHV